MMIVLTHFSKALFNKLTLFIFQYKWTSNGKWTPVRILTFQGRYLCEKLMNKTEQNSSEDFDVNENESELKVNES